MWVNPELEESVIVRTLETKGSCPDRASSLSPAQDPVVSRSAPSSLVMPWKTIEGRGGRRHRPIQ